MPEAIYPSFPTQEPTSVSKESKLLKVSLEYTLITSGRRKPHRKCQLRQLLRNFVARTRKKTGLAQTGGANQKAVPEPPRLHALIIGIDDYASDNIANLVGAVADASQVEAFLKEFVVNPKPHINKLVNEQATRKMVIKAIRDLALKGQKDDPFFIFYAGHGTEVKNTEQQTIQAILPYDVSVDGERAVHPIPDTTLGALIADLSEKVGNNITVIFDSCYSGSGTRDGKAPCNSTPDPEYPARFVTLDNYCLPNDLDRDIFSPLSGNISQDVAREESPSSSTHILLAACKSTQLAREHNRQGEFTRVLLKLLKNTPFHELTYSEVVPRLDPLKDQHPQCEGDNAHRHFFGGKIVCLRHCYRVQQKEGAFTLNVGELSGIFQGATFNIYASRSSAGSQSEMIATMTALSVSPFATTLLYQDIFPLPTSAVAFQKDAGVMKKPTSKLYVALNGQFSGVSEKVTMWENNPNQIRLETADRSKSCLELAYCSTSTTSLTVKILDPRAVDHGLANTNHTVSATPEKVLGVLSAAAHFYFYLDLKPEPKDELKDIQRYITVCFNKLEPAPTRLGRRAIDHNLYRDNLIALVVERSLYGIKLTNTTTYNLYVYAFYFDFTELSILKLYGRRAGQNHLEFDLRSLEDSPENTLSIGFGPGNTTKPIKFTVPVDQDIDVGYIKFIFTTQPIDLEHVERTGSAFELVETKGSAFEDGYTPRGASLSNGEESVELWSTVEIPVILSKL